MAIERVDQALLARGLAGSIDEARLFVLEGRVYLGGGKVGNPSQRAKPGLTLTVRDNRLPFVSRGGLKLQKALSVFAIDPAGAVCLDIGASTGGFTDVLLQNGARAVYAVDVGFGLLDWKLRVDPRVTVMERVNARSLTREMFPVLPELGVTDVSFISLKAILPPALCALSGENRRFVALVKPQFEAPRALVGKGGVVRDRAVHESVLSEILRFVKTLGWAVRALDFSPITGAEGNIEFLLDLVPGGVSVTEAESREVVQSAWETHGAAPNPSEKALE